jgi:hypothetical protein
MPFDPTITTKVRIALAEDGHQDLIDGTFHNAIAELEEELGKLALRVQGVENAQRAEWTGTGIWEEVKKRLNEQAVKSGTKLFWTLLAGAGALLILFIGWFSAMAWRGMTK